MSEPSGKGNNAMTQLETFIREYSRLHSGMRVNWDDLIAEVNALIDAPSGQIRRQIRQHPFSYDKPGIPVDCGQADRDSELLRVIDNPDIVFYGPHPCENCGKLICKAAREQGGMMFEYPKGIVYPNHNWTQHVCEIVRPMKGAL